MSRGMRMNQYVDSLRKKAREYAAERETLQARITKDQARMLDLNGAIAGSETLLRVEGVESPLAAASVAAAPAELPTKTDNNNPPALYNVIHETLADGKPRTVKDIIVIARNRGVNFGEKEPYRTVAFTLMGIARGKRIQRLDGGLWQQVTN
jgi:hypothetical protein